MVTVFEPTRSGIEAVHCEVPIAAPDPPVLVDQVTEVTAVLSLAVPENVIEADPLEIDVAEGVVIVREGGVLSVEVGGVAA